MEVLSLALMALLVGVVVGGLLARVFSPRVAMIGSLVMFGLAAVLLVVGAQQQGWDAIGYAVGALVFCAPLAAGMGLVGVLAWYGLRRGRRAALDSTRPPR